MNSCICNSFSGSSWNSRSAGKTLCLSACFLYVFRIFDKDFWVMDLCICWRCALQGKPGFPGLKGEKGGEGLQGRDGRPGLDGFPGPQVCRALRKKTVPLKHALVMHVSQQMTIISIIDLLTIILLFEQFAPIILSSSSEALGNVLLL